MGEPRQPAQRRERRSRSDASPCVSNSPSAATSAATTTCPVVPASRRPFASTIGPRGPIRSTVRYAWPFASAVYAGPCRIWIDQARSASRQSATPTSDCEPADADEEARAAEERRVRARVRLKRRRPPGRARGSLTPAPGIGGGDGYGGCGRSKRRLRLASVGDGSGGSLFVGELVGEQREPEAAPGEIRLAEQRAQALGDGREPARRRGLASAVCSASRRSGESSSSASRSAATVFRSSSRCGSPPGGEHEHRAPPRCVQFVLSGSAPSSSTSQTSATSNSPERGSKPAASSASSRDRDNRPLRLRSSRA